uniref:HMG box domain-containing protein n=1 Tax=Syphacia muris TaxID=451379 RepID=A0A0N5AU82_9BILA
MNTTVNMKKLPKNGTKFIINLFYCIDFKTIPILKLKDKNAPKGPRSAYLYFLSERRDFYLREHKEMKYSEVIAAVAIEWGKLTDEQKKVYLDKASEDRERYNKEFLEYQKTNMYKEFEAKKRLALKEMSEKNANNNKKKGPDYDNAEVTFMFAQEKKLREIRKNVNSLHEEEVLLKREINRLEENLIALQEQEVNSDMVQKSSQLKSRWESLLINALSDIAIPGVPLTNRTADLYMAQIQEIISKNPNDAIITAVKNAICQIDFMVS